MASAHPLTDHDEIRRWAESRRAKPACVKGTGGKGDPGMIRLDFPGFTGEGKLAPIKWDQWFKAFDDNNLALLVQDETARGQRSNFNKLVSRERVEDAGATRGTRKKRSTARRKASGRRGPARAGRKTSAARARTSRSQDTKRRKRAS